ncbi:hypothetical protein SPHINGO361_100078 [Sphingomonas sp. EC-HK361]|nr:hypothetical protein SPHINGO361_100078 [Sphingomonas sp. EC-HK361]
MTGQRRVGGRGAAQSRVEIAGVEGVPRPAGVARGQAGRRRHDFAIHQGAARTQLHDDLARAKRPPACGDGSGVICVADQRLVLGGGKSDAARRDRPVAPGSSLRRVAPQSRTVIAIERDAAAICADAFGQREQRVASLVGQDRKADEREAEQVGARRLLDRRCDSGCAEHAPRGAVAAPIGEGALPRVVGGDCVKARTCVWLGQGERSIDAFRGPVGTQTGAERIVANCCEVADAVAEARQMDCGVERVAAMGQSPAASGVGARQLDHSLSDHHDIRHCPQRAFRFVRSHWMSSVGRHVNEPAQIYAATGQATLPLLGMARRRVRCDKQGHRYRQSGSVAVHDPSVVAPSRSPVLQRSRAA